MRKQNRFERSRLDTDMVKSIIDAAAERGLEIMSFTGGEPLLHLDQLVELIDYAGAAGIKYIRSGTNGFVFQNSDQPDFTDRVRHIAERLAGTPIRNFWISIDSAVPEQHECIRGFPGVVRGLEKAIPIFHEAGIYPAANLGINRSVGGPRTLKLSRRPSDNGAYSELFYGTYREAFADFYSFVINLGFSMVNMCYPMSDDGNEESLDAVYAASSSENIVTFDHEEKSMLFRAVFDVIPEFRPKIRIFSPRVSLYMLYRHYRGEDVEVYPCRGGIDFFFIDAQKGHTYPCGYRGDEDMGFLWDLDETDLVCDARCFRCDWECFRDPSEMAGTVMTGLRAPLKLLGKYCADPEYFRLWAEDLRYYHRCCWFDGRRPQMLY